MISDGDHLDAICAVLEARLDAAPPATARRLLRPQLRWVEQHVSGRRDLFLLVSSFNRRAQDLYRRHGYAQVGEIPDYIVDGHSELIFRKRLA